MIDNETFKECVKLCDKRNALLKVSCEINDAINEPVLTVNEFRRECIREKSSNTLAVITLLLSAFICYMFLKANSRKDLLWIVIIPWIAAISVKVLHMIYVRIAIKSDVEDYSKKLDIYHNEHLPVLYQGRDATNLEIQKITEQISQMNAITEDRWDIAGELWYLVISHRANDYKEACWLWDDMEYKRQQTQIAREQAYYSKQAAEYANEAREYAYESMVAAQNAEINSNMNLILTAYNTMNNN